MGGAVLGLLLCLAVVTGCGSDDGDDAGPRATVPETTTSTAPPTTTSTTTAPTFEPLLADPALTVEEQVEAAYLFSWEIYLDAVERGDPTFLPLAYADEALEVVEAEVDSLVGANQRVRGSVEHAYAITVLDTGNAVALDAYLNHLVLHDASGSPLEPDPASREDDQYTLVLREDRWLVTEIVRY